MSTGRAECEQRGGEHVVARQDGESSLVRRAMNSTVSASMPPTACLRPITSRQRRQSAQRARGRGLRPVR